MPRRQRSFVPPCTQRRNGVDGYPAWSEAAEARYNAFCEAEMKALCWAQVKVQPAEAGPDASPGAQ